MQGETVKLLFIYFLLKNILSMSISRVKQNSGTLIRTMIPC